MKAHPKILLSLLLFLLLAGCSKEERESSRLYKSLLDDVADIEALSDDTNIRDKFSAYSRARHKIERLRTRYAATKKGGELLGDHTLSGSHTAEDILAETKSLEVQALAELSENEVSFITYNTLPTPEMRNCRLESHGISLARQGEIEAAEAIIPHLINTLSIAIVQLEIAKAYQLEGNIGAAREISENAFDNISRYNFNERICSTASCENEETRKRMVDLELRRVRIELYSI